MDLHEKSVGDALPVAAVGRLSNANGFKNALSQCDAR
jgi:hypothetical protein